ncbi:MAG: molybdate ABC transporter permease subunit [Acidobacteriota bacterium]
MTIAPFATLGFSLWTAALALLLILPPGVLLAWVLARHDFRGRALVETVVALPLVLPPVATGLVLLQLLGRRGWLGRLLEEHLGLPVVFTWRAVVLAMAVMSFPLLVRSARAAFEAVPERLEQVARTLGAGEARVLLGVTLPLARHGLVAGALLGFARALGEFGATVMVAGIVPGRTVTLSVGIFQLVQLGEDAAALRLAALSATAAFATVAAGEWLLRRAAHRR